MISTAGPDDPLALEAERLAAAQARARRIVLWVAGALVLLIAVVIVASVVLGGEDADEDDLPAGLLRWPARVAMVDDEALVSAAADVWRRGVTVDGAAAALPGDEVHLLWADRIGGGRVVIMQAIGTDGQPYVAQVAEHGDPAALELDVVERLPSELPPALAVTYDGNIDLSSMGLGYGRGSALIQIVTAPSVADDQGVWRFESIGAGSRLEQVALKPNGMSKTFLQLDVTDPAGIPVVLTTTVEARAGVAGTIAVHGNLLVPTHARVALVDDPAWGPSGRVDGEEFTALEAVASSLGLTDATGFVAGSAKIEIAGEERVASLVVVHAGGTSRLACVLVDGQGADDPTTVHDVALAGGSDVPLAELRVLAATCRADADADGELLVVAAARPGSGQVVLDQDGAPIAGPAEVVATQVGPDEAAGLVARLDAGEGSGSTYRVLAPTGAAPAP